MSAQATHSQVSDRDTVAVAAMKRPRNTRASRTAGNHTPTRRHPRLSVPRRRRLTAIAC